MTRHLDQIVATYERANRIFSGLSVTCETARFLSAWERDLLGTEADSPVAWSIGSDIYFEPSVVERAARSREAEVALAGLNFHELGHVLYTPMKDSWLRGHLDEWKGLASAFNVLEDQRIETLLAAQYPTLANYFVQAFQSFVVENTESVYTSHLLAHGRQFLPARLRAVLSAEFVGTWEERFEAEAIIDDYRTLVLGPEHTDLRDGNVEAIGIYSREKRLREGTTDEMIDAAYLAWRADAQAGLASVLVTESSEAVAALNARARAERILDGDTDATREVVLADGARASVGDLVITRQNDRRLRSLRGGWVRNGDRWKVTDVRDDGTLVVRR